MAPRPPLSRLHPLSTVLEDPRIAGQRRTRPGEERRRQDAWSRLHWGVGTK